MSVDIVVPEELWGDSLEGVMLTWIYQDGATVQKDQVIGELMVEKAQLELHAPATGRLRILTAPETVVGRSHVLGRIEPT
ncbi:MAG TPA: biotin/lipoyl-containing protein [Steroidobacteraceae bacterium]|jgi:pyruvate/2-oxoglutarate dehydrogenase complex dihydrolipoamide acyltransferase (E2) component